MNEPTNEARAKLEEMVRSHARQISEHFDNVQIFASNLEEGGETTYGFIHGVGNWHARENQVREWVEWNNERLREKARHSFASEEEDDEDE